MNAGTAARPLLVLALALVGAGSSTDWNPSLGQAPPPPPPLPRRALGFSGTLLPGLGMRVNSVYPFSPAQRIGLQPGDMVLSINGIRAETVEAYQQALAASDGFVDLMIRSVRNARVFFVP